MNRFTKFMLLGMVLALLTAFVLPIAAQEQAPGPGEGGTIVEANLGDDPSTFNPVLSGDAASSAVISQMYPDIIGLDDMTLTEAPNVDQALATGWSFDETGTVLTVTLRQDAFWADGVQITAADYLWAFNAVQSGQTSSPRTYVMYQLADGTISEGFVHEVTATDDFTLVVRLGNVARDEAGEVMMGEDGKPQLVAACDALADLNDIPVVPAHIFEATFGMDYASMESDPYFVPSSEAGVATFGTFTDPFIEFGVQTSLLADQKFPDTELGFVSPGEWLYQNVENTTVMYERFLAGDFTYISVAANNQNAMRDDERFQTSEWPANSYIYMGYNLADPSNPQPGRDAEGNLIDQGKHPIFSDVRVRQAIAYAIDTAEIIGTRAEGDNPATGILQGNGYPVATNTSVLSSTNDELEALGVAPYPYDPAKAMELLEEAGWTDSDGDGVRECNGCLYAEAGALLEFELITNAGNVIRESIGETVRAKLAEVGFVVNFEAIEFGTLLDVTDSQQFDAYILGWNLGLPFSPGGTMGAFYGVSQDIPGSGFNSISYQNEAFDALLERADGLPAAEDGSYGACDQDARDALYAEAQKMLWEDQPYLWFYLANTMVAAQANVGNFDPIPNNATWNIDSWFISNQ